MAEQEIRYCTTADGAGIAYYAVGQGKPMVFAPGMWSHIRPNARTARTRGEDARHVASGRVVVRYDGRGMGSSDRRRTEFSLEARVRDLEAIMDHLGLEGVTLYGSLHGGPTCLAYAARYPERVSNLILVNTYASGDDYRRLSPAGLPKGADASQARWDFYYRSMVRGMIAASWGIEAANEDDQVAILRDSMSPAAIAAHRAASREIDVTAMLPEIGVPALVIHVAGMPVGAIELSQELAAGIIGARLVDVSGWSEAAAAIDEFMGVSPEAEAASGAAPASGTAVILFADIVDSTALTERLGDAAFRGKARELDASLRAVIRECSGTPVEGKLVGDGVLAVFTSARQAIDCALRCNGAGESVGLQLHLGIHAGDVIREGNNVYGGAVNIAARISALSAPGEVLVSDTVRGLARTSAGVSFDDRSEHELKGVGEPVRVWVVREGDA